MSRLQVVFRGRFVCDQNNYYTITCSCVYSVTAFGKFQRDCLLKSDISFGDLRFNNIIMRYEYLGARQLRRAPRKQSMFNAHFSSMSFGHLGTEYTDTKYWQQPEIEGLRAKHNRNVLAPALISAMFCSGLLGRASMEHVISLCEVTCVDSTLS